MTPGRRESAARIGRRAALARGTAATLAAARALAPGVFVGCSLGIPPRQAEPLVHAWGRATTAS